MFTIIILLVIVGFLYHVYQCYRMRNMPPYIEGAWPIVGHSVMALTAKNYHSLFTSIINNLLQRKVEYASVRFGIWDFQLIINPEDAYLITNSCLTKDTFYDYLNSFLGEGLITAGPSRWKIHRKLLNSTFNQQVLDGYLHEFNNQTRKLIDSVAVEAGNGPFDPNQYLTKTILQIVCATSLGSSIDEEDKHTKEMLFKTMHEFDLCITDRVFKFWLHNDFIYKLTGRKKQQDLLAHKLNSLSQAILDKKKIEFELSKKQSNNTKPENRFQSFMDFLLELSEDGRLSNREIFDEVNTFFAAGTDTMATALSNAMSCIGTYRTVQDRIMEELQEVFQGSDRDVEKKDLPRLNYLEAVVKETLRLYPVVPVIGRVLDKDIEIKGYTLPAGSRCYIIIYGLQRHWTWGPDDADTFRPERWLDGTLPANMKGWAAFGIGRRNCIGANFAVMCMKTVLAGFLRKYSIRGDVTQMVQEFYITSKAISGHEISIDLNESLPSSKKT